jgi:hypothetical protein
VIKINELRIGNLISDLSDRTGFVKSLAWNKVAVKLEFSTINTDCDGVKPIPLTEEWLLKFGFVQQQDVNKDFINRTVRICLCVDDVWRCVTFIPEELMDEPKIQHVHQLQNLYWCLTGEELTMK